MVIVHICTYNRHAFETFVIQILKKVQYNLKICIKVVSAIQKFDAQKKRVHVFTKQYSITFEQRRLYN